MTPAIHLLREDEERIQRGRSATTFVTMEFWKEMQAFGETRIAQRLAAIETAPYASAEATKGLVDLWRIEQRVIRDFLKYPYAAIEAAGGGR